MPQTEPTPETGARPEVSGATSPAAEPAASTSAPFEEADAEIVLDREEYESLQRDLDQALAKADEHWKLYLGAHAEMENLRKRAERDVQNAHKFALERFFGELLPVRDSLEMGLAAARDAVDVAKLREGVELTLKQLAAAMEKFGVRILEGYGATECSPVVAINSPLEPRVGSVGRFVPGLDWKLEPMEGVTHGGRLLVRGPNIMRGYLNPEANAAFQSLQGWYDTGDIVHVDREGYVEVLGRLKRFAKISGEMVSLTAIEDALAGAFPQFGLRCQVAVVAVPSVATALPTPLQARTMTSM